MISRRNGPAAEWGILVGMPRVDGLEDDPPPLRCKALRRACGRLVHLKFRLRHRHRHRRLVVEQVVGRPLIVLPDVLNPKLFRTGEFLAEQLSPAVVGRATRVLDLGTGSGIGAITAARWSQAVTATDISDAAARCVRINALLHDVVDRIDVFVGDLFAPVAGRRFDLVLFNPPYLPGWPRDAFDRAFRGGDVIERFLAALPDHLAPAGRALVLLSSDADIRFFLAHARASRLAVRLVARRDLIFEVVYVFSLSDAGSPTGS